MKFMSSFQCLMGGNGVSPTRFQDSSVTPTAGSSLLLLDNNNNNDTRSSSNVKKKKKKKKKSQKVIKVFQPDGEIKIYDKPIRVSEVMTEEYMVCRSDSFYIGQKIPSLSQHDRLQLGHIYFLLPTHLFHSVLSFVTIASFTAGSSSSSSSQQQPNKAINDDDHNMKMKAAFLKKAATSSCPPFDIHKTPSGTLRIRVSDQFISQLMMDQAAAASASGTNSKEFIDADLLCTTPLLHREYKQLVIGSRSSWKPKLEMIKETPPPKGKRKVKLLLSASINRMKRKMNNSSNKVVVHQISSSTSASKKKNTKKKKKKTLMTKKSSKPVVSLAPLPPPPPPLQTASISKESIKSSKSKIKAFSKNKTR